jgi:hypothetical protein
MDAQIQIAPLSILQAQNSKHNNREDSLINLKANVNLEINAKNLKWVSAHIYTKTLNNLCKPCNKISQTNNSNKFSRLNSHIR